jgi:PAS domain S-box-containing protein/putative nucleotidyltransferase with HDIG domain
MQMEKEPLRILIIDDSPDDTLLLERELRKAEWEIILRRVDTGEAMMQMLEKKCCDLILCDYMIPGFGGMEALEIFKTYNLDIPFIMISGKITEEMAIEALLNGAQDFVLKQNLPRLIPAIRRGIERIRIISERKQAEESLKSEVHRRRRMMESSNDGIAIFNQSHQLVETNGRFAQMLGYTMDEMLRLHIWDFEATMSKEQICQNFADISTINTTIETRHRRKNGTEYDVEVSIGGAVVDGEAISFTISRDITERKEAEKNLHNSLIGTVRAISDIVEMRDPYTAGHQKRVASLACAIARELGMDEDQIEGLALAAQIHDVGKIQIPAEILSKPTQITEIEYMMIKTHPEAGYQILKDIQFPWPIAEMVRQHHEKLDGSGYPHGLKEEDIRLESRILSVADIVEAMASHRPYRPSLGIEVALEEILHERGTKLDAAIVDACIALFRENRFTF